MPDLAAALSPHLAPDPRPVTAPHDRLAGVLALVVGIEAPALLLTERATSMSRHAGEVSFPGGLVEPGDADVRATALRETEEEIGLPGDAVTVLGALDPVHTHVSATLVVPFVGCLDTLPPLTVNAHEIAAVHLPSIGAVAAAEERRARREDDGTTWRGWWYELPSCTVWGATGFVVHALLELLRREAPWAIG